MEYNAPVLVEVGEAANLVLGFRLGGGDTGSGADNTLPPALALGLDD